MTYASVKSKQRSKPSSIPINGEEMYLRLLAINSFKKVPLERVLAFENATVPLSLFSDDGSMLATKKSDFLEKLETLADSETSTLNTSSAVECFIFDAMAVVQMLQPQSGVKTTFSMMAASFWNYIFAHSQGAQQVHVVFDRYVVGSLKLQTRMLRGETVSTSGPVSIHTNIIVNDWKRVVSCTKSKSELTRLFTLFLTENAHKLLDDDCQVYVAGGLGDTVLQVTSSYVAYVPELKSNHEEADSRLMLHIAYAGTLGTQQACVFSPDTDVFVLLIHFFSELNVRQIYFKTGRKTTYRDLTRYIPVHLVAEALSPHQLKIILPVYCLTGCDTCSSFYGIGKKKAFHIMCKASEQLSDLSTLGTQPVPSVEVRTAAVLFVGLLYGHSQCTSLNTLRSLFVIRKKHAKPRKLPPTNDSFMLHLLRCTLQLLIWRSSLTPEMPVLDPVDFGYTKDPETELYTALLMTQSVAAPELLSDLVCTCTDLCSENCVCSNNEQPCTNACSCEGSTLHEHTCENLFTMLADVQTGDDSDDVCLI